MPAIKHVNTLIIITHDRILTTCMFIIGVDSSLNAAPPNFDFFYSCFRRFCWLETVTGLTKRRFILLTYCSSNIKYIPFFHYKPYSHVSGSGSLYLAIVLLDYQPVQEDGRPPLSPVLLQVSACSKARRPTHRAGMLDLFQLIMVNN